MATGYRKKETASRTRSRRIRSAKGLDLPRNSSLTRDGMKEVKWRGQPASSQIQREKA